MLTRSFVMALAAASMFLAGCQTMTTEGYLSPDKRSQERFECPSRHKETPSDANGRDIPALGCLIGQRPPGP